MSNPWDKPDPKEKPVKKAKKRRTKAKGKTESTSAKPARTLDTYLKDDPPTEQTKKKVKLYGLSPNDFTEEELQYIIERSDSLKKFAAIPGNEIYLRMIIQADIDLCRHEKYVNEMKRVLAREDHMEFDIKAQKKTSNLVQSYQKACQAIGLDPRNELELYDESENEDPMSTLLLRYEKEIRKLKDKGLNVGELSPAARALATEKAQEADHSDLSNRVSSSNAIDMESRMEVIREYGQADGDDAG